MPKEPGRKDRIRNRRKALLALAVAAPVLAAVLLHPTIAVGDQTAPVVDEHGSHAAGMGAELAQVRAATAKYHRVAEAVADGYELGWVNGSGVRIVAGCVSSPTAGAMGYHYFNAALMADTAVDELTPEVLVYAPSPDQLESVG